MIEKFSLNWLNKELMAVDSVDFPSVDAGKSLEEFFLRRLMLLFILRLGNLLFLSTNIFQLTRYCVATLFAIAVVSLQVL